MNQHGENEMNQMKILFACLSVILCFASCGKDTAAVVSSIAGTWMSECENMGDGTSRKFTNVITTSYALTGTTSYYAEDTTCTTETSQGISTAVLTDGSVSTVIAGGYNFTFTWKTFTMTPLTANAVLSFNSGAGFCSYTGWTKDIAYDVAGKNCGGVTVKSAETAEYGIIKVSGNTLQFGDTSGSRNGTTVDLRPNTLETRQYTRQ